MKALSGRARNAWTIRGTVEFLLLAAFLLTVFTGIATQVSSRDVSLFLFVAGMWFQDLFTYDFRRTEMCIIPYGTQEGEISFCAYNTGVGWRNIIEKMHMNATVAKWYKEHGRHAVYANNKPVDLESYDHDLVVDQVAAARVRERGEGPQTAHEEELMMRRLFDEMVLGKKQEKEDLVQINL